MGRVLLNIGLIGGLLVAGLVGGCRPAPRPGGGYTTTKAEQTRKQAESMAMNVIAGVAKAQARQVPELALARARIAPIAPTPPIAPIPLVGESSTSDQSPSIPQLVARLESSTSQSLPRPGSPVVVSARVSSSIPYPTDAEAEDDAFANAAAAIERKLAELDPPVHYRPSLNEVRHEFVRRDSRTVRPPSKEEQFALDKNDFTGKRTYVEYDVEVTADQVRELRTRDRVAVTLRVLGGVVFASLAIFLFLRLDEWTKGYLTHWLACAAVLLVGGAAAALYFV